MALKRQINLKWLLFLTTHFSQDMKHALSQSWLLHPNWVRSRNPNNTWSSYEYLIHIDQSDHNNHHGASVCSMQSNQRVCTLSHSHNRDVHHLQNSTSDPSSNKDSISWYGLTFQMAWSRDRPFCERRIQGERGDKHICTHEDQILLLNLLHGGFR